MFAQTAVQRAVFVLMRGSSVKWNVAVRYLPTLSVYPLFIAATITAASTAWWLAYAALSSADVYFFRQHPLTVLAVCVAAIVLASMFVGRRIERHFFGRLLVPIGAVGSGYILGRIVSDPIASTPASLAVYFGLFAVTSVLSVLTKTSQRELHKVGVDAFERSLLASEIARKINQSFTEDRSTVVAVEGPWGSGKTTTMKILDTKLGTDWSVVWFHPLSFRAQDHAWQQLSSEIRAEIDPVGEASRKFLAIGDRALSDLIRLLGFRSDFPSLLTSAMPVDTMEEMRFFIRQRLKKKRLAIFIDDMDRLPADRAFEVLTVTMQHLRRLDCLVVLGIDRERTLSHLSRTLHSEWSDNDSQTFIDKLIDLRFPLIAPTDWQRWEYLRNKLELNKEYLADYHRPVLRELSAYQAFLPAEPRSLERLAEWISKDVKLRCRRESPHDMQIPLLVGRAVMGFRFPEVLNIMASQTSVQFWQLFLDKKQREEAKADLFERIYRLELPESKKSIACGIARVLGEALHQSLDWMSYLSANAQDIQIVTRKELRTVYDQWRQSEHQGIAFSMTRALTVANPDLVLSPQLVGRCVSFGSDEAKRRFDEAISVVGQQRSRMIDECQFWLRFVLVCCGWIRENAKSPPISKDDFSLTFSSLAAFRNFSSAEYAHIRKLEDEVIENVVTLVDENAVLVGIASLWRDDGVRTARDSFKTATLKKLLGPGIATLMNELRRGEVTRDLRLLKFEQLGDVFQRMLVDFPDVKYRDSFPEIFAQIPADIEFAFNNCAEPTLPQEIAASYIERLLDEVRCEPMCNETWIRPFWSALFKSSVNERWKGSFGSKLISCMNQCGSKDHLQLPQGFDSAPCGN